MTATIRATAIAVVASLACAGVALSQPQPPLTDAQKAEMTRLRGILASQHPQFGDVSLLNSGATLHLGKRFYFLGPDEAKQVLKEWRNPPSAMDGVLGIVFPAGTTFLDDAWGAVVTFEPSGYVSDKDADKADYDKLIRDAQAREVDENAEAKKGGFPTSHLVGWAQRPSYDKARHVLIWARDIRFEGDGPDTLNYDLRILGRRGLLSLNLVSTVPQLPQVRADATALAGDVAFNPGNAYGDFQVGKDKTAEYGVAGLVAAGLGIAAAQKLGLLAVVLLFAKKALVFILAGFAALAAWLRRLFKGGKSTGSPGAEPAPPPADEGPDKEP